MHTVACSQATFSVTWTLLRYARVFSYAALDLYELSLWTLRFDANHVYVLLQVVFVSTEVSPWSKVGGLGDVMGALPVALAARQVTPHTHTHISPPP